MKRDAPRSALSKFPHALTVVLLLSNCAPAFAQTGAAERSWIEQAGANVTVLSGVVALIVSLIGVPVAWMKIRETRATIRKIELEAQKLERETANNASDLNDAGSGIHIQVNGDKNVIDLTYDPRLLGPLLIIVDFVIAWILISLLGYGIRMIPDIFIHSFMMDYLIRSIVPVVAFFLFIPIVRDAYTTSKWMRKRLLDMEKGDPGDAGRIDDKA